jgi:hypothetical protein
VCLRLTPSTGPGRRSTFDGQMAAAREAPCPQKLGCSWTSHRRKHFPHRGLKREHTAKGPAKYLPGTTEGDIRALETETVGHPTRRLALPPQRSEYVRAMGAVIGWDRGRDATFSFAECSGGATGGRSYHGRPMSRENRKLDEVDLGE